jgi:hypothetical protein
MEVVMPEFSEPIDRERQSADANKNAVHFMVGVQRMMLEEAAFAAYATLDRIRTESLLFSEFASKLGAAHSVQDWKTMGSECGQHQLEFIRRDCDRMLKHGERLIEAASKLLNNRG